MNCTLQNSTVTCKNILCEFKNNDIRDNIIIVQSTTSPHSFLFKKFQNTPYFHYHKVLFTSLFKIFWLQIVCVCCGYQAMTWCWWWLQNITTIRHQDIIGYPIIPIIPIISLQLLLASSNSINLIDLGATAPPQSILLFILNNKPSLTI